MKKYNSEKNFVAKKEQSEDKRLDAVKKAIELYNEPGSEYKGHGFQELKRIIEQYGEPAYSLLCKEMAERGNWPIQRYICRQADKYLSSKNVQYIANMRCRTPDIEEFGAVVLANNWNTAGPVIQKKIKEADRILQGGQHGTDEPTPLIYNRQNLSTTYERVLEEKFNGSPNITMLATALGLAFMKTKSKTEQQKISKLLDQLNSYKIIKIHIPRAIERSVYLSQGESLYYWQEYKGRPRQDGDEMPYGLKLSPSSKTVKAARQKFQKHFKIKTWDERFYGKKTGKGTETAGHRNIISETFHDHETGKDIPSIVKVCKRDRAEKEKRNFETLKAWGLPVPNVLELTPDGIRVEDLSDGGKKRFLMGDDFKSFKEFLKIANNPEELQEELNTYLEILKEKGVEYVYNKNQEFIRAVGIVMDPKTRKGKLYFADVDHLTLPN